MPLPSLKAHHVAAANAREYVKRTLVGEPPEAAAAAVGGPVLELEAHPAAQALVRAVDPREAELLQQTADKAAARTALESREGRAAWLAGVIAGTVKFEGAFGNLKEFPPAARLQAVRLLGLMHGDFVTRHEIKVDEQAVITFRIPDNGRLPAEHVVDMPVPSEP